MKRTVIKEAFISNLSVGQAKPYEGEPIYRVIGIVEENNRPQMYAIGVGPKDEEKINYFTPVIRAARYTTEESFLFVSKERAEEFFKEFKSEYDGDFKMKDFRVAEYHPFREVIRLIPIDSPYGRAWIGEQRAIEKKYDDKQYEASED